MKKYILISFLLFSSFAKAQQIDSIYVNLYTDSLKKGTFNYINIDGLLSNGHYIPLDSTHLIFTSSAGNFSGNSLWVDSNFSGDKIFIKVILKKNPGLYKEFEMYIKRKPDGKLKTLDELNNEMKHKANTKKNTP